MSIDELKKRQIKLKEALKKVVALREKIAADLYKREKPGPKKDVWVKKAQAEVLAETFKNKNIAKAREELKHNKIKIKAIQQRNFQELKEWKESKNR